MSQILRDYADLKLHIKQLEAKADEMKEEVKTALLDFFAEHNVYPSIEGVGSYSMQDKGPWKYSSRVENLKIQVKELEKEEKATGEATHEENLVPVFKEAK